MSEGPPLPPAQADAIAKARAHGALLHWPGGRWSYPGCGFDNGKPTWTCGTGTVKALIKKGLLRYSEWKPSRLFRYPVKVEPV